MIFLISEYIKPPMARVTVEDCIDKVESPYELVLVAKERATQLNSGLEATSNSLSVLPDMRSLTKCVVPTGTVLLVTINL